MITFQLLGQASLKNEKREDSSQRDSLFHAQYRWKHRLQLSFTA